MMSPVSIGLIELLLLTGMAGFAVVVTLVLVAVRRAAGEEDR